MVKESHVSKFVSQTLRKVVENSSQLKDGNKFCSTFCLFNSISALKKGASRVEVIKKINFSSRIENDWSLKDFQWSFLCFSRNLILSTRFIFNIGIACIMASEFPVVNDYLMRHSNSRWREKKNNSFTSCVCSDVMKRRFQPSS